MKKTWNLAGLALFALTAYISVDTTLLPKTADAGIATKGPNVVNVVAKEYKYEMPDSIPAGPTLFHFTDNGNQLHHMTLVKLEQGKTLADFTALPPGPPPKWAVFMGGPNTPLPHGGQDEDIVDLTAGNYAVICVIPDKDGKPHMMKGMAKALTVMPSSRSLTTPSSDLTLTLSNYSFEFSTPPAAGKHIIRVVNKGSQPHEAEIFHLMPGKKGEDIANWVFTGMQGPPPGAPVAGISPESPDEKNTLLVDFKPGDYALICFVPDAKDGKAHAAHGMIYNFKVG